MSRTVLVAVALTLVAAGPAKATDTRSPRLPAPPGVVVILDAPCGFDPAKGTGISQLDDALVRLGGPTDSSACSSGDTIWLGAHAPNRRATLWHEYGHVVDGRYLTNRDRRRLGLLLMGFKPDEWHGTTSEFFADAYAACALGRKPRGRWMSTYGYQPTRRQHGAVCRLIRHRLEIVGLLPPRYPLNQSSAAGRVGSADAPS